MLTVEFGFQIRSVFSKLFTQTNWNRFHKLCYMYTVISNKEEYEKIRIS